MAVPVMRWLPAEEGSVTPVAVVVSGLLMCLVAALAGVMQVADAYVRLAARAEQTALLSAQRVLLGESGCVGEVLPRGTKLRACRWDETGTEVSLSRTIEVWSQPFEISAVGRYLITE